jgi:hypothetical protein
MLKALLAAKPCGGPSRAPSCAWNSRNILVGPAGNDDMYEVRVACSHALESSEECDHEETSCASTPPTILQREETACDHGSCWPGSADSPCQALRGPFQGALMRLEQQEHLGGACRTENSTRAWQLLPRQCRTTG